MVTVEKLIEQCYNIESTKPRYGSGGDGSDGTCDCIGLIIGAIRRAGGYWGGTHGSNYTARSEVHDLVAFNGNTCQVGQVVLKSREKGESGWGLPDGYRNGSDLRDYYHIGIIVKTSPLDIMHCTSGCGVNGITHDHKQGGWKWMASLNKVDYGNGYMPPVKYEEVDTIMANAVVFAANGEGVNLRAKMSTESKSYMKIPCGTKVEAIPASGTWSKVTYSGATGYMMSKFLKPIADSDISDVTSQQGASEFFPTNNTPPTLTASVAEITALVERVSALEKLVATLTEEVANLRAAQSEIIQKISDAHSDVSWG